MKFPSTRIFPRTKGDVYHVSLLAKAPVSGLISCEEKTFPAVLHPPSITGVLACPRSQSSRRVSIGSDITLLSSEAIQLDTCIFCFLICRSFFFGYDRLRSRSRQDKRETSEAPLVNPMRSSPLDVGFQWQLMGVLVLSTRQMTITLSSVILASRPFFSILYEFCGISRRISPSRLRNLPLVRVSSPSAAEDIQTRAKMECSNGTRVSQQLEGAGRYTGTHAIYLMTTSKSRHQVPSRQAENSHCDSTDALSRRPSVTSRLLGEHTDVTRGFAFAR